MIATSYHVDSRIELAGLHLVPMSIPANGLVSITRLVVVSSTEAVG